jgi:hypothetical protein
MIAHIAGLPVEEILIPLAGSAGAGVLLSLDWLVSRLKLRKSTRL